MKTFGDFLLEFMYEAKTKAIHFLNTITVSSRSGSTPDQATTDFLKQTVGDGPYTLYRGLTIRNASGSELAELSKLKPGDDVPKSLIKPNGSQLMIHTTKNISTARSYAKGGPFSIVYKMQVDPRHVVCDTTNLRKILDPKDLTEEKWKYFDDSQEVLLDTNAFVKAKIVEVKTR